MATTALLHRLTHPSTHSRVVLFVVLACLLGMALEGWPTWQARDTAIREDETETSNLARSLAQHAHDVVKTAETVLEDLRERVTVDGLTPQSIERLHRSMIATANRLPILDGLFLYDAAGRWVVDSRPGKSDPALNNADRDYFQYHRMHDDQGIHIDRPVRSRSGGAWILPVSLRIDKPDGSFGWVILATVSVDYLQSFFQTFEPRAGGSITLLSQNGFVIARNPADERTIGSNVSDRPVFQNLTADVSAKTFPYVSRVDRIDRLGSMQRVSEYPLLILVSHSTAEVLAHWWSDAMRYLTIGCIAAASLIFLGIRVAEQVRVRAEAERRYRLLSDYSGDAILCANMNGDRIYVSPSFSKLTGWSNEESLQIQWRSMVHPDDKAGLEEALTALKNGAEQVTSTFRYIRKDGAFLWVEGRMQIIPGVNPAEKQIIANLRDITKRKKAEDEIIQLNTVLAAQAKTDGLTGLANRRRFDEVLASEWARSIRLGTALSLLMIDVDRFKLYNDRYGHQQGDLCLKTISDVIKGAVRRPGDLAARYGGEEIVVVLPETGEAGAREVAESIRRAVEDAAIPHMDNVPWRLATASIGVATLHPSPSDTTPGTLVSDADEALYHAKASGRNRVSVSKGHPALCDQGILIDLFPAPR
jgi:diguanylate cyclase (GGDEF)-like protein/PAS domain S-box-containing protein